MAFSMKLASAASACVVSAALLGVAGCGEKVHKVDVGHVHESKDITIADFNAAAVEITNKMLAAPRMRDEIAAVTDDLKARHAGRRPLIMISRIRNDTGLGINMVDYLVDPIEETLTNNSTLDFFSEDPAARDIAAGNAVINQGAAPRLADFTLTGVVTKLQTNDDDIETRAYVFRIKVISTATQTVVFTGDNKIAKERSRATIGG